MFLAPAGYFCRFDFEPPDLPFWLALPPDFCCADLFCPFFAMPRLLVWGGLNIGSAR